MPKDYVPDKNGEVADFIPKVPCGRCINCARNKSLEWVERLQLEKQRYPDEQCSFLTLTYAEENIPLTEEYKSTLRYEDFQSFMKRLRSRTDGEIRFFMCGEYGSRTWRPHYHALLFGYDFFREGKIVGKSESGMNLYYNDDIQDSWKLGIANFGFMDNESIAYVAQYTTKKITTNYSWHDDSVKPPFIQMSRRPGIGGKTYAENLDSIDDLYIDGRRVRKVRYYQKLMEKDKKLLQLALQKKQMQEIAEMIQAEKYKGMTQKQIDDHEREVAKNYERRKRAEGHEL